MAWEEAALAWVERNATLIAAIEFGVLALGGGWAVLTFLALRRERKLAAKRHAEVLSRMDAMVGKSVSEQREIVQDARKHVGLKDEVEHKLTKADGTVETHHADGRVTVTKPEGTTDRTRSPGEDSS